MNDGSYIIRVGIDPKSAAQGGRTAAEELKRIGREAKVVEANVRELQKRLDMMGGWRKRLSDLARAERKERFDQLSIEEKLTKLAERRAQVEQRLARAQSQGNELRSTALRLRLRQLQTTERVVGRQVSSPETPAAMIGWRQRLGDLARAERKERFDQLSIEEKLTKLAERRAQVEQRLARAQSQGNELRSTALRLRLRQIQTTERSLGPTPGSPLQNVLSSAGSALAQRAGVLGPLLGALGGGAAGSVIAPVIGTAVGSALGSIIGNALTRSGPGITSSLRAAFENFQTRLLELADNLSGTAEQLGLTSSEILRIRQAAASTKVPPTVALAGISSVQQSRSLALSDPELAKIFANYGVSKEKLEDQDVSALEIAKLVRNSLGRGGMQLQDKAPLGRIFGRRPERMVSMLSALPQFTTDRQTQAALKATDDENRAKDLREAKKEEFLLGLRGITAQQLAPFRILGDVLSNVAITLAKIGLRKTFPKATGLQADGLEVEPQSDEATELGTRTAGTIKLKKIKQPRVSLITPAADELAKIGLFVNGPPDSARRQYERNVEHKMDELKSRLERLNDTVRNQ